MNTTKAPATFIGHGNPMNALESFDAKPLWWALQFDQWVLRYLKTHDYTPLITDFLNTEAGQLSVPTLDHYLPMLYVLGVSEGLGASSTDVLKIEFEGVQNASISMLSFSLS